MAERANLALSAQQEPSGERSANEIRRDIVATRESIKDTVGQLNDRVETALDWKTYVAESPFVALAAAAGLGFLASGLFRRRRTARERFIDVVVETVEELSGQVRDRLDHLPSKRGAVGGAMKAAATAVMTQAVAAYVKGKYLEYPPDSETSNATNSNGSRVTQL